MQSSCGLVMALHRVSVTVGWALGHMGRRSLKAGSRPGTWVWTLQRPLWEEDLLSDLLYAPLHLGTFCCSYFYLSLHTTIILVLGSFIQRNIVSGMLARILKPSYLEWLYLSHRVLTWSCHLHPLSGSLFPDRITQRWLANTLAKRRVAREQGASFLFLPASLFYGWCSVSIFVVEEGEEFLHKHFILTTSSSDKFMPSSLLTIPWWLLLGPFWAGIS